jgi:phage major head subunit gpT-like protein
MNENARRFMVVVPVGLYLVAVAAVSTLSTAALQQNLNPNLIAGLTVDVQMNARLTWTDSFTIFRTDSPIKGLIRQTEQETELKAKAEGSEFEFDTDAWQFGIDNWRGVGYGYWQRACYVTMI